MRATLAAPDGIATISVSLRDASSGRTAAGPKTCPGLVFADRTVTRACGPATASVPHGKTYVVVMTWTYTRDGKTANGTAKGGAFAW